MSRPSETFLTVKELCERWKIGRTSLYRLYSGSRPKLASYTWGASRRFRLDDVERVEAMRRRGPGAPPA